MQSLNYVQAVDKDGNPISLTTQFGVSGGISAFPSGQAVTTGNYLPYASGASYVYEPIDWRSKIKPEHLYPNKDYFKKRGLDLPTSIEGLDDSQLLIKLAGIRYIAKLRGFKKVKYTCELIRPDYACIKCTILWAANSETPYEIETEDVANASERNVSGFGDKFLETIAANRAFVRCVRNYLNIPIVGEDEVLESSDVLKKDEVEVSIPSSHSTIAALAAKKGYDTFDKFKNCFLVEAKTLEIYSHKKMDSWVKWEDIPVKESRILVGILSESPNKA